MSNFTKVVDLNKGFGRATTSKAKICWTELNRQLDIIEEEFEELREAVRHDHDWEEMKDAIGDVLVTTYGLGYVANIDCDKLMDNISNSNFSKFCRTQEEVAATVEYYDNLGVRVEFVTVILDGAECVAVKSAAEHEYTENGKTKSIPKGKLLKNINWNEPDLNVEN